jgi:hypothetical protein
MQTMELHLLQPRPLQWMYRPNMAWASEMFAVMATITSPTLRFRRFPKGGANTCWASSAGFAPNTLWMERSAVQ